MFHGTKPEAMEMLTRKWEHPTCINGNLGMGDDILQVPSYYGDYNKT